MARGYGQRVPGVVRRKGIRSLQSLLAAGIEESEACEQIARQFDVSLRSAFNWLRRAYDDLSKEADVPRAELLGVALRRRRFAMARAAKVGDWRTYLAAADSEAKLLGLNAPVLTETRVIVDKVQDMSRAVVEVVQEFFADQPDQRARFVEALRARLNAQLTARPDRVPLVIDAEREGVAQLVAVDIVAAGTESAPAQASDSRSADSARDVAP